MLILIIIAGGDSSSHFLLASNVSLVAFDIRAIDTRGGNILLLLLVLEIRTGIVSVMWLKCLHELIMAWGFGVGWRHVTNTRVP